MHITLQDVLFSYDDIIRHAIKLYKNYNPFIKLKTIGKSYDNREIISIEVGRGNKALICSAGVHARESINPMVLLEMAEFYAMSYSNCDRLGKELHVKKLLDTFTIIFIPVVNPDGYEIARQGFNSIQKKHLRKICINKKISYYEWKENARGIDINRNFECKSFAPNRYMLEPNSEKETKTLIRLFDTKPSIGYIDFHSRGNSIFYHRKNMGIEYNELQYKIATYLSQISGYTLENPIEEMDNGSGGNTVHYYSEYIKQPAITVETIKDDATFPLKTEYLKEVYEKIYLMPLAYISKYLDMKG